MGFTVFFRIFIIMSLMFVFIIFIFSLFIYCCVLPRVALGKMGSYINWINNSDIGRNIVQMMRQLYMHTNTLTGNHICFSFYTGQRRAAVNSGALEANWRPVNSIIGSKPG